MLQGLCEGSLSAIKHWRPCGSRGLVCESNKLIILARYLTLGLKQWSSSSPNTDHILFGEFNNTGPGAWRDGRVPFATQLEAGVSITDVLGSTGWIDPAYL